MTTLEPRPPYSREELQKLYPSSLQLEQVQVLLRHGERTPVKSRFTEILPTHWPYCRSASSLRSAVLDPRTKTFTTLQWRRHLETFHPETKEPVPAHSPHDTPHDICDLGTLTDVGRETTHALGERLRHLYVSQLGFLPSKLLRSSTDWMYLRTTPVPRALESLQQVFHGLYPSATHGSTFDPPTIITRSPADETLYPNENHCARFRLLAEGFRRLAAEEWNRSPEVEHVNRLIGKYMPMGARAAVDSNPSLLGILDSINATRAHGPEVRLPEEFYDHKLMRDVERIALSEWYRGYAESNEYRRLGVGALMGDVVRRMLATAHKQPATPNHHHRLGLSGCHDTTIGGVIASLGVPLTNWPPFTSHIALELFSTKKKGKTGGGGMLSWTKSAAPPPRTESTSPPEEGWYVRLRYNDAPVTIPGCKVPGNHLPGDESFCTLGAFKRIVDRFTPQDWKKECSVVEKHTVPKVPEKAGHAA